VPGWQDYDFPELRNRTAAKSTAWNDRPHGFSREEATRATANAITELVDRSFRLDRDIVSLFRNRDRDLTGRGGPQALCVRR
jgi:hypothetical protein